jgi:hypothetical protein
MTQDPDQAASVLAYSVVPGTALLTSALTDGATLTAKNGEELAVTVAKWVPWFVGGPWFLAGLGVWGRLRGRALAAGRAAWSGRRPVWDRGGRAPVRCRLDRQHPVRAACAPPAP